MTDAEYEALRRRVRALADRWIGPLGLRWWRIDIAYDRGGFNRDDHQRAADTYTLMTCSVMWQYLKATITVNAPECAEMSDERLEETFVHELAHIFLNEMREVAGPGGMADGWLDHEERVATLLGKAFVWLRDDRDRVWREQIEAATGGGDDA